MLQSPGVVFYFNQMKNTYHVDVSANNFTWYLKTSQIALRSWVHVLFTWSKTEGITLYQNGFLVTESNSISYFANYTKDDFTRLMIGRSTSTRMGSIDPNIQMSDLRILYQFLTSSEVTMYAIDEG